jgi:hypothetical protein
LFQKRSKGNPDTAIVIKPSTPLNRDVINGQPSSLLSWNNDWRNLGMNKDELVVIVKWTVYWKSKYFKLNKLFFSQTTSKSNKKTIFPFLYALEHLCIPMNAKWVAKETNTLKAFKVSQRRFGQICKLSFGAGVSKSWRLPQLWRMNMAFHNNYKNMAKAFVCKYFNRKVWKKSWLLFIFVFFWHFHLNGQEEGQCC